MYQAIIDFTVLEITQSRLARHGVTVTQFTEFRYGCLEKRGVVRNLKIFRELPLKFR